MPRPIGASSSSGHGATSGCGANISAPNAAHSQEDNDDDSFAQTGETFDKANWTDPYNNTTFCDLCVEQIKAGNRVNGFMTTRGYHVITEKYYLRTGLRHSKTQLKNRWDLLKGLFSFRVLAGQMVLLLLMKLSGAKTQRITLNGRSYNMDHLKIMINFNKCMSTMLLLVHRLVFL